ncbi:LpqB family beta-propeller domain-containing protein [Arthrobacter sp. H20]|uniref:LpqB family beta-propeller domain-containing protein n=1 Tax=Arthrobacter sp. H20 TaxID=1267981 RepID=UPI0004B5373A|nr:LpqB family beta-propeller domain-containing protein [Arthrobacter sp. H20]
MPAERRSLSQSLVLLVLPVLLVISGCSSIPTSGPVGVITADSEAGPTDPLIFNPSGPRQDADPESLLRTFIRAGTGAAGDYEIARDYLTDEFAMQWQPEERIIIYSSAPQVSATPTEGVFQVQLEVEGTINAEGIRTGAVATTTESLTAELAQDADGQWRITSIPDGIMISSNEADLLLETYSLYFYSSSFEHWVPDVRWFVNRAAIAANIVEAMLEGPAPYLQGSVTSAFPEGTTLGVESVPIVSGTATVDLSADVLQDTSDLIRQQMQQQLRVNLAGLNTVNSVQMTVGQPVFLGDDIPHPNLIVPVADPPVGNEQIVVSGNELFLYQTDQTVPIGAVPSVAALDPQDPAMALTGSDFAFLNGNRTRLYTTGPDEEILIAATGRNLTAPSFDPNNWVWTAGTDSQGQGSTVTAIPPGGTQDSSVSVTVPWLADGRVLELRVSRDGSRALVVTEQDGVSRVLLAGIIRNRDRTPQSLSAPRELFARGPVNTAKWVNEDTVIVAQTSADAEVTPEFLSLDGSAQTLAPLEGITHISAGTGPTAVFAATPEGVRNRVGDTWSDEPVEGVQDPAFPG